MRLNAGELVELAGVKDFNDYWRHLRSLDLASRVVGMGVRLKDVFSFVRNGWCGLEWLFFIALWLVYCICLFYGLVGLIDA
jgi:hypothetical protein